MVEAREGSSLFGWFKLTKKFDVRNHKNNNNNNSFVEHKNVTFIVLSQPTNYLVLETKSFWLLLL